MLNWIENLVLRAELPIKPADNTITVSRSDAAKFNSMPAGSHIYLTVRMYAHDDTYEVVKYQHTTQVQTSGCATVALVVDRDVMNTGRRAFPAHTKLRSEPCKIQIEEFVRAISTGE